MKTKLVVLGKHFTERIYIDDIDYIQEVSSDANGKPKVKLQIQNDSGGGYYDTFILFSGESNKDEFLRQVQCLMCNPTGAVHYFELI
ncbi:hypothetical protein Kuja_0960 [Vibrio phage vB_VchM_Kuja]|uniref:Uncharacterized protein n=1 Tax=Vibrio phage vB_VchM_Kuja TaxID=2686437 RepID=A0A6B9JHT7_9CAUD|nr:hypothetical protein HWC83_gp140 [Vibrio phage vB_VchM_Kuja]QGZ16087.1 hypothetical protein Kuja_0960 [Vibrio phage vB_VchM_Kuja]